MRMKLGAVLLGVFLCVGCAVAPYVESVTLPGYKLTGKHLFVIINETGELPEALKDCPNSIKDVFDSVGVPTQVYYNEYLVLQPVTPDSLFLQCGDGAVMVFGTTGVTTYDDVKKPTSYAATIYRCEDRKVVWRFEFSKDMIYNTEKVLLQQVIEQGKSQGILE